MWAIDLGTTNTLVARWDRAADRPEVVVLPALARGPGRDDSIGASRVVPSAVHVLDKPGFLARLGLGRLALIGRPALELNAVNPRPNFAPGFKRALARSPLLTLARA